MTPEERADRAANLWMAAARTQSGTRYDKRVFIANEIRAAIVAEREACAALCAEHARLVMEADDTGDNIHTARYLAVAIRARA